MERGEFTLSEASLFYGVIGKLHLLYVSSSPPKYGISWVLLPSNAFALSWHCLLGSVDLDVEVIHGLYRHTLVMINKAMSR